MISLGTNVNSLLGARMALLDASEPSQNLNLMNICILSVQHSYYSNLLLISKN